MCEQSWHPFGITVSCADAALLESNSKCHNKAFVEEGPVIGTLEWPWCPHQTEQRCTQTWLLAQQHCSRLQASAVPWELTQSWNQSVRDMILLPTQVQSLVCKQQILHLRRFFLAAGTSANVYLQKWAKSSRAIICMLKAVHFRSAEGICESCLPLIPFCWRRKSWSKPRRCSLAFPHWFLMSLRSRIFQKQLLKSDQEAWVHH